MSDLIDRKDTIRAWCKLTCGCEPEECTMTIERDGTEECNFVGFLSNAPAVDAVEVVRCKDCAHRRNSRRGWYCGYEYDRSDPYEMTRRADDENYYCADAERKEKQEDVAAVQVER